MGSVNGALPASQDRAVVNGAQEVSALRASVPSADEVYKIIGKLTEPQRNALHFPRGYSDPNTVKALRRKGLLEGGLLTALGVAVRGVLTGQRWHCPYVWEGTAKGLRCPNCDCIAGAAPMVMVSAQAIEARRAETGTGSIHESAVRQDAPNPLSPTPHQGNV